MSILSWLFKKKTVVESIELGDGLRLKVERVPTVKFDTTLVTDEIETKLLEDVKAVPEVGLEYLDTIYGAALTAVTRGGDAGHLAQALLQLGVTKKRAGAIALRLIARSRVRMDNARRLSMGITHAKWMFSGAPCGDAEMTDLHASLDGKRYLIEKGMKVGKRYIYPAMEEGCRCTSSPVIPGFTE